MRDVINKLRIDLDNPVINKSVSVTKGDTVTRTLCITLAHGGVIYPLQGVLAAMFKGKKEDGRVIYNNCVIDGNEIRYTITNQTISKKGLVECCIELYDENGEVLQTPVFNIQVTEPVYNSDILESANEYKGIEATVALAEDAKRTSMEVKEDISQKQKKINETYNNYLELKTVYEEIENSTRENSQIAQISCDNADKYCKQAKASAEISEKAKENAEKSAQDAKDNVTHCQESDIATAQAKAQAVEAATAAKESELTSQNAAAEAGRSAELAEEARKLCESYADVSPEKVEALEAGIIIHTQTENPHGITKETIGLENVENTADIDKEVLSASRLQNTTLIGHSTRPVYFDANGVPVPINYTLQSACTKHYTQSVSSGSPELPTSGAVYTALSKKASYEEGTWTPQLMMYHLDESVGHYTRIGNLCFLQGAVRVKEDINGTFVIANPPFFTGTSDSKVARRWVYYQDPYNYTGDGSYSVLGRYKSSTNISASNNGTGSNQGDVICTGSYFTLCPDDTEYGAGASVYLKANTYIEFNLLYSLMNG